MPRASRYLRSGYTYHLTHRCHDRRFLLKFVREPFEPFGVQTSTIDNWGAVDRQTDPIGIGPPRHPTISFDHIIRYDTYGRQDRCSMADRANDNFYLPTIRWKHDSFMTTLASSSTAFFP